MLIAYLLLSSWRALVVAKNFKRAEADLVAILQELDETRAYFDHRKTSLHAYAVGVMGLSDSTASNFIAVARKAAIIPALQSAIREGEITVSKARKITGVLAPENQTEWVSKAISLPCRKLEEEVALRDERKCTYVDGNGTRCTSTRWLDTHHIVQRSHGGTHETKNLTTLCSAHHQILHRQGVIPDGSHTNFKP